MTKYSRADLNAMTHREVVNVAAALGIKTTVLLKIRSGQPHKRVTAAKSDLINNILGFQGN